MVVMNCETEVLQAVNSAFVHSSENNRFPRSGQAPTPRVIPQGALHHFGPEGMDEVLNPDCHFQEQPETFPTNDRV